MNGTDHILAHIREDADAEVKAVLEEARRECEKINARYASEAEKIREKIIAAAETAAKEHLHSTERIAEMEKRKTLLAEKQALIKAVFDKIESSLIHLPRELSVDFLAGLAADASVTGEESLLLNEEDKKNLGEAVKTEANRKLREQGKNAKLILADGTGQFSGGLVLLNGDIAVNCTVALLLETKRDALSTMIVEALFG